MSKRSSFWEWKGKLEASPGSDINDAVPEAIEIAKKSGGEFTFDFNGVSITVRGDSSPGLILRDWNRGMSGSITSVGPYPPSELSATERAHDAEVEAANEARRAASRADYERRAAAKQAATNARLAQAPPIALADAEGWQKSKDANSDGYGGGVMTFAEQWARLMQLDMANGAKLEDIADATSSEADTEGITGFMYGCAVSILSKCWAHGETLRRWHNLKTQIRNEGEKANESGGVLNPALLSIG
jgi:hypothetical protein